MIRLLFRPEAEADLLAIVLYVAEFNATAAITLAQRLRKRCELLKARPLIGRLRPELGEGIRCLVERPYVLLYRFHDSSVEIVAVVHGARELPSTMRARIENDPESGEAGSD